jgi:hypothetical protein
MYEAALGEAETCEAQHGVETDEEPDLGLRTNHHPSMYEAICTEMGAALWRLFRENCCVAFDIRGMVGVSGMYGWDWIFWMGLGWGQDGTGHR